MLAKHYTFKSKRLKSFPFYELHSKTYLETDDNGYAVFHANPGDRITPVFNGHRDFNRLAPIQGATMIVPENAGPIIKGPSLQIPSKLLYGFLMWGFGWTRPGLHDVFATVSSSGIFENDVGEAGATVALLDMNGNPTGIRPCYLGAVFGLTEWFTPIASLRAPARLAQRIARTKTSTDGGVLFRNVPPGNYKIVAEKYGVQFTTAYVRIIEGQSPTVINASPPGGLNVCGRIIPSITTAPAYAAGAMAP